MRRTLAVVITLIGFTGFLQAQIPAPVPDTARISMPAIELPEITIVGKKAITLPFARKGEIFDVNLYDAPAPDSAFLISRPELPLPVGEYTRLAERVSPWHASVGGGIGNLSTLSGNGFMGWTSGTWDMHLKGNYTFTNPGGGPAVPITGFVSTVAPGSATHAIVGAGVHSIITTDNDLLKSIQLTLNGDLRHEAYSHYPGQMILPPVPAGSNLYLRNSYDRSNNGASFGGGIGSVQRKGFVFSLSLSTKSSTVTDRLTGAGSGTLYPCADSSASVSEPRMYSYVAFDVRRFRVGATLSYASASLSYSGPAQSPSLFSVTPALQWNITDRLSASAGISTGYGSGSGNGTYSLFLPAGSMRWDMDGYRELSIWWQPEMRLVSYDSLLRRDPWLNSQQVIRPERTPVNFGGAFSYTTKAMSLSLRGSYKQSSNTPVIHSLAGSMNVYYTDAVSASLDGEGMLSLMNGLRFTYGGTLQRVTPDSGDTQLPMTPSLTAYGRADYDMTILPLNMFVRFDYSGKQNVDFSGSRTLDPYVLISSGASMPVYSRMVVSLDVFNLTGTSYSWWEGYGAPGAQFNLSIKMVLR